MAEATRYKIGVFGGTFDPIHYGHLRSALEVYHTLGLDQVRFIPLAVAVHRCQPLASPKQRLAMVQAAIANMPGFIVDDREISSPKPSYTINTLLSLHHEWPDTDLYLLIGTDAFQNFLTWYKPLEILNLAHIVVMHRPNTQAIKDAALNSLLDERLCTAPQQLATANSGSIIMQTVTQLDISSTAIRLALAGSKNARFLLPDPVLDIIRQEKIYSSLPKM